MKADKNGNLSLNCYSDASFNVHADAKSHSGITIFLGATLFKSYKIKMLNKNIEDLQDLANDILDDAVLMGVDENQFLKVMKEVISSTNSSLKSAN